MRLAQFELVKYGHFADQKIDFATGKEDIHLVYGANEAGKTMFRCALYDFLFGFENQSKANFKFNYKELLLRAKIEHNGEINRYERIKGKSKTLRDESQKPIDEQDLSALIAGIDRKQYEQEFAIDGDNLRKGIDQLVKDSNRFSEALYETVSGLTSARKLIGMLEQQRCNSWAERSNRKTSYRDARYRYEAAQEEITEISVRSDALLTAHNELESVEQDAKKIKKRHESLGEKSKSIAHSQGAADEAKKQLQETQRLLAETTVQIQDSSKQLAWQETDVGAISAKLAPSDVRSELATVITQLDVLQNEHVVASEEIGQQESLTTTEKFVLGFGSFGVLAVIFAVVFIIPDVPSVARIIMAVAGVLVLGFVARVGIMQMRLKQSKAVAEMEKRKQAAVKLAQYEEKKAALILQCSLAHKSSKEEIQEALSILTSLEADIAKHSRLSEQRNKQQATVDSYVNSSSQEQSEDGTKLDEQMKKLFDELEAAERVVANARSKVSALKNAEQKVADAEQRRKDALAAMANAVREHLRARFGEAILRSALKKHLEKNEKPLLSDACKHISVLTEHRYVSMKYDDENNDLRLVKHDDVTGNGKKMDELSAGTLDQAYLALRLAGLRGEIRAARVLPFVADDLFVHFDDGRTAAGFRLLAEIAKETQVIYLTHHKHLIDIAKNACSDVNILRLPDPLEAKDRIAGAN